MKSSYKRNYLVTQNQPIIRGKALSVNSRLLVFNPRLWKEVSFVRCPSQPQKPMFSCYSIACYPIFYLSLQPFAQAQKWNLRQDIAINLTSNRKLNNLADKEWKQVQLQRLQEQEFVSLHPCARPLKLQPCILSPPIYQFICLKEKEQDHFLIQLFIQTTNKLKQGRQYCSV